MHRRTPVNVRVLPWTFNHRLENLGDPFGLIKTRVFQACLTITDRQPERTDQRRYHIATSDVVQVSMAGPLRPGAAFAPPPGGVLGGLDLPAPARRSVAMIARRGGRVEDRSSAVVGRLRLVIRVPYDWDGAVAAHPPGAGATGGAPARPGGRPRR
jgi:hypothetical protein